MSQTQKQLNRTNPSFNYLQKGCDWIEAANCLEQSPIDIIPENAFSDDIKMKIELLLTDHDLRGLKVVDTGNTLQLNGPFSKLIVSDVEGDIYEFEAVQFHFHAPAEHTIHGKHYDLELHIVHQITKKNIHTGTLKRDLAVVGVFFELDETAAATPHPFISALKLHDLNNADVTLNMHNLLKKDLTNMMTYYAYKGSLTTPPCTENANWYVIEKPLKITKEQLDHFNLRWKDNPDFAGGNGNNRPVQPLNGRTVIKSTNCCVMGRSLKKIIQEEQVLRSPVVDRLLAGENLVFEDLVLASTTIDIKIDGSSDSINFKCRSDTNFAL